MDLSIALLKCTGDLLYEHGSDGYGRNRISG
jgi:hypothetical protein